MDNLAHLKERIDEVEEENDDIRNKLQVRSEISQRVDEESKFKRWIII